MLPRWKRAVSNLDATLGELLGKVYVEQYFKADEKARLEQLVENLRGAFREGIDKLEWMGPETKKEAQAKLATFRPKIGYPNKWRDYSKLEIKPDDLVGNMIARVAWRTASISSAKAGKPVDPEDWGMTPQTVNAYYNPVRNEIVFPAAILQPPFFDPDADDAVNYGGIGARHRPRDGPRLRRPGPPLRREGRSCATGGPRRTPRSSRSGRRTSSRSTPRWNRSRASRSTAS